MGVCMCRISTYSDDKRSANVMQRKRAAVGQGL